MSSPLIMAQNEMIIQNVSGQPGDTITVVLVINNSDDFVAFQTDIQLPDQVQFIPNSVQLTSRANGHALFSSFLDGNILRVISYSLFQSFFQGDTGGVLNFQVVLGSKPGSYPITLLNPIISDINSTNILTGFSNGCIVIMAPDIKVSPSELNFGETPLQSYTDRMLEISNIGNQDLYISKIVIDNDAFKILGDISLSVPPGGYRTINVRFQPQAKGTYSEKLTIYSNDPDEPQTTIDLNAVAFAVNELHMKSASGRSGHPIWINFSINNMEPFVGFQFDMVLPSVLTYLPDSIKLSDR
ncbi:MAG: choice-of-anchor D domain-containing protein, partial [Archaeoglobus sp.]|nr:choice-of-anchor D domain-containing protein [Archaeoglobus sp.]